MYLDSELIMLIHLKLQFYWVILYICLVSAFIITVNRTLFVCKYCNFNFWITVKMIPHYNHSWIYFIVRVDHIQNVLTTSSQRLSQIKIFPNKDFPVIISPVKMSIYYSTSLETRWISTCEWLHCIVPKEEEYFQNKTRMIQKIELTSIGCWWITSNKIGLIRRGRR